MPAVLDCISRTLSTKQGAHTQSWTGWENMPNSPEYLCEKVGSSSSQLEACQLGACSMTFMVSNGKVILKVPATFKIMHIQKYCKTGLEGKT